MVVVPNFALPQAVQLSLSLAASSYSPPHSIHFHDLEDHVQEQDQEECQVVLQAFVSSPIGSRCPSAFALGTEVNEAESPASVIFFTSRAKVSSASLKMRSRRRSIFPTPGLGAGCGPLAASDTRRCLLYRSTSKGIHRPQQSHRSGSREGVPAASPCPG